MTEIRSETISNSLPQLSYLVARPAKKPLARLIILHGYGDHAGRFSHFMQWLAERDVATWALDFRGHGRSAGKPCAVLRWDEYLTDLKLLLALKELTDIASNASTDAASPLFILGHSHGGLIATTASMQGLLNHCRGIILVSPYLQLKMPVPFYKRMLAMLASRLHPTVAIRSGLNGPMVTRDVEMIADTHADPYCRGIATPRWFSETTKVQRQVRLTPEKFNHPLLALVPGDDTVADASATVAFYDHCSSTDKTIFHYPEHRHELLREVGREKIFNDILAWMTA